MTTEDLHYLFSTDGGYLTITEVLLKCFHTAQRIEHLLALDLVMRHGTPEHQQAARQHLLDELERQAREQR
jgi:hypothetical protein